MKAPMAPAQRWHGQLKLQYHRQNERCIAMHQHQGPLRILQSLYPEDPGICHNVIVHPPGGLVNGDVLDIDVQLQSGTHGLITTPGATRFYRSTDAPALQRVHIQMQADSRLEWLPLETLAYNDCDGHNHWHVQMAPGCSLMAWDVLGLGLPTAQLPFVQGQFEQHLSVDDIWLERALIHGADQHLLNSALGWAGHRAMGTLLLAHAEPLPRVIKGHLLDATREQLQGRQRVSLPWGVSAVHERLLVLRVLGPVVEPVMQALREVWALWREEAWGLKPCPPRVWAL